MAERVVERRALELLRRPLAKRPARGGDDHPSHFDARPAGRCTAEWRCARCRPGRSRRRPSAQAAVDQVARHDQRFLVGERDALAARQRGERGVESRRADDGVEHDVDVVAARRLRPDTRGRHAIRRAARAPLCTMPTNSGANCFACASSSCALLNAVRAATRNRSRWRVEHAQRGRSDRPGRPENRHAAALVACHRRPREHDAQEHVGDRHHEEQAVEPVENAAMPGNECELSFTPASRLSSDSARSPICAAPLTMAPNSSTPPGLNTKAQVRGRSQARNACTPTPRACWRAIRRSRPRPSFPG